MLIKNFFNLRSWSPKLTVARLLFVIFIILAIVVIRGAMQPADNKVTNGSKTLSLEESQKLNAGRRISKLKNSSNLNDMRGLITAYETSGDHASEARLAEQVAAKTGSADDYLDLLIISVQYNVPDKDTYIDKALQKLKPQIKSLDFKQSYNIARQLDTAGRGKDALGFYEQAVCSI